MSFLRPLAFDAALLMLLLTAACSTRSQQAANGEDIEAAVQRAEHGLAEARAKAEARLTSEAGHAFASLPN